MGVHIEPGGVAVDCALLQGGEVGVGLQRLEQIGILAMDLLRQQRGR